MGLSQDSSNSECTVLIHFSMSLTHKYANLKEPYNQDIKEHVATKNSKKEDRLYMKSSSPEA